MTSIRDVKTRAVITQVVELVKTPTETLKIIRDDKRCGRSPLLRLNFEARKCLMQIDILQ